MLGALPFVLDGLQSPPIMQHVRLGLPHIYICVNISVKIVNNRKLKYLNEHIII